MADVLTTGVWNRIMVADLGFSADLRRALLTGLRYFLAPLGVIAGRYSDTHTVGGLPAASLDLAGPGHDGAQHGDTRLLATAELVRSSARLAQRIRNTAWCFWLALVLSFLLFSLGSAHIWQPPSWR